MKSKLPFWVEPLNMLAMRATLLTSLSFRQIFWICALAHCAAWVLIPTLSDPNVLTDTIEGYAWGHEWPLGTYKHPPLAAWLLEASAVLSSRAQATRFILSQASVLIAFWAVWQTGRRMVSEVYALTGALLLIAIGYYNILIPEFNPNVLQLPLWALIALFFHRACKEDLASDWLLLAFLSASGIYAKYSTGLLLGSFLLLFILRPETRVLLRRPGPYLAAVVFAFLLLPHFEWLADHHFITFHYTEDRFEPAGSKVGVLTGPAMLLIWQAAALLPAVLLYGFAFGFPAKDFTPRDTTAGAPTNSGIVLSPFDRGFLVTATFGPFCLAALIALLFQVKIRNMWGASFWNFFGLWLMVYGNPKIDNAAVKRFSGLLLLIFVAGVLGYGLWDQFSPYLTHKAARIDFPGAALGSRIEAEWHKRFETPLRYVVGDTWVGGNVAYYAEERPHLLINGDFAISAGVSPRDLARDGGVIVWCRGDCTVQTLDDVPIWFWAAFKDAAEVQPVLTLSQQGSGTVPDAKIGWAILPPGAFDPAPMVEGNHPSKPSLPNP